MYPTETVMDFNEIMTVVIKGLLIGLMLFFTIYFLAWSMGMLVNFFKRLAR